MAALGGGNDDGLIDVAVVGNGIAVGSVLRALRPAAGRWKIRSCGPEDITGNEELLVCRIGSAQDPIARLAAEEWGASPAPDSPLPLVVICDAALLSRFAPRPAAAILQPHQVATQLLAACEAALAGMFATGQATASDGPTPADAAPVTDFGARLTDAESAVYRELLRGATNREIAAALGVSINTVKFHLGSVFAKLGVRNRTEAVSRGADTPRLSVEPRWM